MRAIRLLEVDVLDPNLGGINFSSCSIFSLLRRCLFCVVSSGYRLLIIFSSGFPVSRLAMELPTGFPSVSWSVTVITPYLRFILNSWPLNLVGRHLLGGNQNRFFNRCRFVVPFSPT